MLEVIYKGYIDVDEKVSDIPVWWNDRNAGAPW